MKQEVIGRFYSTHREMKYPSHVTLTFTDLKTISGFLSSQFDEDIAQNKWKFSELHGKSERLIDGENIKWITFYGAKRRRFSDESPDGQDEIPYLPIDVFLP